MSSLRPRAFNEQGTLCISSCLCPGYIEAILCVCILNIPHIYAEIYVSITVTGFRGDIRELIPPFGWKRSGWSSLPASWRDITTAGQDWGNSRTTPLYGQNVIPWVGKIIALTHKSSHTSLVSGSMKKCLLLQICCISTRKRKLTKTPQWISTRNFPKLRQHWHSREKTLQLLKFL